MDVAANRVGVPAMPAAFIGPARPTSAYLGEVTMIAGPENETAVRVMFRCVWGPRAPSRHVLVWLKPSVSEEALALRLCQIFDIPTIGNVTIELVFKWMLGLMPYGEEMDKGKLFSNNLLKIVQCAN